MKISSDNGRRISSFITQCKPSIRSNALLVSNCPTGVVTIQSLSPRGISEQSGLLSFGSDTSTILMCDTDRSACSVKPFTLVTEVTPVNLTQSGNFAGLTSRPVSVSQNLILLSQLALDSVLP